MINFLNLHLSQTYYSNAGFTRIETPWTVAKSIQALTLPYGKTPYVIEHTQKCLVASAEQGFLALLNKGMLPDGHYQSITPCFRDEQFSIYHTKYFIKNELIILDSKKSFNQTDVLNIATLAVGFFKQLIPESHHKHLEIVKTEDGYDIEYNKIELGSYGIRNLVHFYYIYGTGLAEPRLTKALQSISL